MSVDLTFRTSFRTRAHARELIELTDEKQLSSLAEKLCHQPFIVLGKGSNVLFASDYDGCVIVNELRGETIVEESDDIIKVRLAAGEIWHDVVCRMSARGFYGLENLALIPGTIGAAPVQNIGAYGVEVSQVIDSVEAFDFSEKEMKHFSVEACCFSYRDSFFKRPENRCRYLITAVTLRLNRNFLPILSYQGLCAGKNIVTASQLLERVIAVRSSKLPDPEVLPNAGSFFKNPVVTKSCLDRIKKIYPSIPFYTLESDANYVKIPAAWLLESTGFKGENRANGAGVYEKHALILVNRGQAQGREIYLLACDMMKAVKDKFNIELVPEVRIVGINIEKGVEC